ncbi:Multidrug resistance protein ABC transporter [Phytophthora megakarya]|uniref:Multidrug resistance protein ABC transporter n=1 Tax=Phytophthora megakarya TaxID=4795 RepID=A0A225VLS7_9STRA|nr:Multidrug resistance protein ABC transporter [Phytophthora megakarya]
MNNVEYVVDLRDRKPPIDSFKEGGRILDHLQGKIEFKNILFRYPTRPVVTVLKNYNFTIEPGQTYYLTGLIPKNSTSIGYVVKLDLYEC